jgi:ribosomal protein S18 acetylase RimI-like enzyme
MPTPAAAVSLRRPTAEEYEAWLIASGEEYVNDIVASGAMSREAAEEKNRLEATDLLPQGLDTPGHLIWMVEAGGETVGWLWLGLEKPRDPQDGVGFIYDIQIHEQFRGRGYGRLAMHCAEEEARNRGLRELALNVFGQNGVARSLYASSGYREVSVQMRKVL